MVTAARAMAEAALHRRPFKAWALLLDLGCFEEANHAYTLADPDHSNARIQYNRSRVMQGLGHWQEAWTLAESRWMNGGEARGRHRDRIGLAGPVLISCFSGMSKGLATPLPCVGCPTMQKGSLQRRLPHCNGCWNKAWLGCSRA